MGDFLWSDERIDTLRKLFASGLSGSQIAYELRDGRGNPSRNAVIGKIHRLGLARVMTRKTLAPTRTRVRKSGQNRVIRTESSFLPASKSPPSAASGMPPGSDMPPGAVFTEPLERVDIPTDQRRTLADLVDGMCKWPVGDAKSPDLFFCGAPIITGARNEPYCVQHSRVAYNGAPTRVDPAKTYRPKDEGYRLQLKHFR